MVDRREQQTHGRLERWVLACTRVTARWHKHLSADETPGQVLGDILVGQGGDGVLQGGEVLRLFILDVVLERAHEFFQFGHELGVGWRHVLELFEVFLDLWRGGWRRRIETQDEGGVISLAGHWSLHTS